MDSFEWNKIAGAVLFALLVAVGLNILSEMMFATHAQDSPAYVIAIPESGEGVAEEEEEVVPLPVLLANADIGAGESTVARCVSCHTLDEGGRTGVGPNLWDIVMDAIGAREGFQYSDGMLAYAAEAGDWTYENLDAFLADPQGAAPGTKMTYAGLKDATDRANLIAYMRTLSADPVPLPEAEAAAEAPSEDMAAEDSDPAEDEAGEMAEPADDTAEPQDAAPADDQQGAAEPTAEQDTAEAPAADEQQEAAATAPAEEEPTEDQAATADATVEEQEGGEQQVAEAPATEEPAEEQVAAADATVALPVGDIAAGESFSRRCAACHTFDAGAGNRAGPNLFGVFGRVVASAEGFSYSDAMQEFSEGGTKVWNAGALDAYLADPRGAVPGTKMIFPPVGSEEDRANIIAYLATLTE